MRSRPNYSLSRQFVRRINRKFSDGKRGFRLTVIGYWKQRAAAFTTASHGCQMSEVRCQKSDVRGQLSVSRDRHNLGLVKPDSAPGRLGRSAGEHGDSLFSKGVGQVTPATAPGV